jgi:hypothetical protein
MSRRHVGLALASAVLAAGSALAAEQPTSGLDYVLRAGGTYSDNIGLQPSSIAESASSLTFGAELHGEQTTGRLRYQAGVELWRYQYLSHYSGGDTFGRGLLSGSYDFSPEHFRWNASINFDQLREDPFRPLAPGNKENVTTLSTGPTLRANLFGAVDTQLDGHIAQALYSGNTVDNQTVGGRLGFGHRTGPHSSLGIGGSVDEVTYLGDPASSLFDFHRREAFFHGDMNGARTQLSAEVGYANAVGDTFNADGPVARIRLTREMSPSLTGYLGYRHEYPTSTTSASVSDPTAAGGGIVNTALVTSSPREDWVGELGFQYKRTRSTGELGFYHLNEDSLITGLGSHTFDEIRAKVTRDLTPRSQGAIYASFSKEDFSAYNQGSNDLRSGVEYMYGITRSVGVEARLEYRSRNGTGGSASFNEFSGGVFLTYSGSLLGRSVATPKDPNAPKIP